jgi:hypothetical protein
MHPKQETFAEASFEKYRKPTRREEFLAQVNTVMPWGKLTGALSSRCIRKAKVRAVLRWDWSGCCAFTFCNTGSPDRSSKPSTALRKRRHALLRKLPPLDAILRGSLIERYKRCGKPGGKCAEGPGHGPKYYLSVSFPGERAQMDYVPQDNVDATRALVANFREVRTTLEEVCAINRELLRRREAL